MITETNVRGVQNGKKLVSLALKSTDSKPTSGVMNGSTCIEVNTGKKYVYDEEGSQWTEIGNSGGGGGGGGDFSTAEVTISKGAMGEQVDGIIPWLSEEDSETYSTIELVDEGTLTVKVPMGGGSITVCFSKSGMTTGDIESMGDVSFMSKNLKSYLVTGDCSISFL